ncbi:adenylate kinase family protein [Streptomyces sp. NPDC127098]|uniref:adenylate kinase family protein n=1 Tax=Streptomyces sp. NPDC127098 TaxID=3347137 RepID=UPI003661F90A
MTGLSVFPVLGPPGAGKTTALTRLASEHPRLTRFGVRDYGLRLAREGDALGALVHGPLARNEMLPNSLVLREFHHFLDRVPARTRVVAVEGYPRDTAQCQDFRRAVEGAGHRIGALIVLSIPDDVSRHRVSGRRICTSCGAATEDGGGSTCALCGGPTTTRRDDEALRHTRRLREYRVVVGEVQSYFSQRGLLRNVDGLLPAAEVARRLKALLLGDDATPERAGKEGLR